MKQKLVLLAIPLAGLVLILGTDALRGQPERPRRDRGAEAKKRRAEFLEKYDADKDGKLSEEERAKAREGMMEARRAGAARRELQALLLKTDTNKDFQISRAEKDAAVAAFKEQLTKADALADETVKQFDENKNRRLDGDPDAEDSELGKALRSLQPRSRFGGGRRRGEGDRGGERRRRPAPE